MYGSCSPVFLEILTFLCIARWASMHPHKALDSLMPLCPDKLPSFCMSRFFDPEVPFETGTSQPRGVDRIELIFSHGQ
jgi:hypothetical protein